MKPASLMSISQLKNGIKIMKTGKKGGVADIRKEQITNMGPRFREWLLNMYNECMDQIRIPKLWHKTHIITTKTRKD